MTELMWLLGAVFVLIEIVGVVFAVDALMEGRTPQGTLAWGFALLLIPVLAVPLYLVFGSRRFAGYVKARRKRRGELGQLSAQLSRVLAPHTATLSSAAGTAGTAGTASPDETAASDKTIRRMIVTPCTRGNRTELLLNGKAFFDAITSAIDNAKCDVLVQFYIIHDDIIGRRFKAALLAAASRGVRVKLLYDIIGCSKLPRGYARELAAGGVEVAGFRSSRVPVTRLQINFRNHRKLLVADGTLAITGGLNIGDEYDDKDKVLKPWRDTAISITGPAALEAQLSFVEDWYFATRTVPRLPWEVASKDPGSEAGQHDARVVIAPTGPADDFESGALLVLHLISRARHRLWIATPYFVPDESIIDALRLAVLRGVDVRVIVPRAHDQLLVKLAMMSFEPEMIASGVRMFRYQPGFMHQKVILSDDLASVGSLNLDNRSMRINFELTAVVAEPAFTDAVVRMLESDLQQCRELLPGSLKRMKLATRVATRLARLMAPVL